MANRWLCLKEEEIRSLIETGVPQGLGEKLERSLRRVKNRSAKGKGLALQRWVCERIAALLEIPYDQQDDDCLIHSRESGQAGVDVIVRGWARKVWPFAAECKSTEKLSLAEAIRQAQANEEPGRPWLLISRCKAVRDAVVMMDWGTFVELWWDGLTASTAERLREEARR